MLTSLLALSLLTQTPALKPEAKPPSVTAPAPLPETLTLKLKNIQLQVQLAQKDLEASEAAKLYRETMAKLGVEIAPLLLEVEKLRPGYVWDQATQTLVKKPEKKDGGK